jgi:hypothetical protein
MRKHSLYKLVLPLVVLFATASASASIIVTDNSTAGPLPASSQDLTTSYPTEILGSLDFPNGVSMFQIYIFEPQLFSAISEPVIGDGIPDTELFLFDSSGVGVYMNDDADFSNTLACLPSAVDNPCSSSLPSGVGPSSPGFYYLAVTRSANLPIDSLSNTLFSPVLSTDVIGPATTTSIADWNNDVFTSPDFDLVTYDIVLTGTIPEPATWVLTASAGLLFALARKPWRRDSSRHDRAAL